jgi:hypothetical protein
MTDIIRQHFESVTLPAFGGSSADLRDDGRYHELDIEEHWLTFQEGWLAAVLYLQQKQNSDFTDVVSDGGLDPRGQHGLV